MKKRHEYKPEDEIPPSKMKIFNPNQQAEIPRPIINWPWEVSTDYLIKDSKNIKFRIIPRISKTRHKPLKTLKMAPHLVTSTIRKEPPTPTLKQRIRTVFNLKYLYMTLH